MLRLFIGVAFFLCTLCEQTGQQLDLLAEEIVQLESLINLQQQKLTKLKLLRDALIQENKTLPQISEIYLDKILQEPTIVKSKGNQIIQATQKKNKIDNFQERSFINRILKKFQVDIDETIKCSSIIQTFSYRTSQDTQSQQMLVVITQSDQIQIYDITGSLMNKTTSEQKQIQHLTSGNRGDDPIFATFGDNKVYVHRVETRRTQNQNNQTSKDEVADLPSGRTSRTTVFPLIEMQFELVEPIENVTDFQYTTIKGLKFFILSDSKGFIHVYHRNGTYLGSKQVSQNGIIGFQKSFPNMLYATKQGIGYFNPTLLDTALPYCEQIPYTIVQVVSDIQQNNIVYVLTANGEIYIYEIKHTEQLCKVKLRLSNPNGTHELSHETHQLISLRYFLLLVDRQTKQSVAFNTSEILSDEQLIDDAFIVNFLGNQSDTILNLGTNKGYGNSHYLIVSETNYNTTEISYYEIILPQKKDSDFFSNFRFPIIIIALVLAFGYQIWSKGKTKQPTKRGGSQLDDEREMEELLSRKMPMNKRQNFGVIDKKQGSPEQLRKTEQLREQIEQIDRRTKQMTDMIGMQKAPSSRSSAVNKKQQ